MRIGWIDSWRGILIFLVVIGHVVGMSYHFVNIEDQRVLSLIYKFIYSFHMPAFFFLSGMTWEEKSDSLLTFLSKKTKRLVVPYLVWGFISACIYILFSSIFNIIFKGATTEAYLSKGLEECWTPFVSILHGGGWPNGMGFQCNSVLWFLPVMFSLLIIFFVIYKIIKSKVLLLFVVVGSFLLSFVIQKSSLSLPWGLTLVWRYLPYFIFGFFLSGLRGVEYNHDTKRIVWIFSVLLTLLHFFACMIVPDLYAARNSLVWKLVFLFVALGATLASLMCSILMDSRILRSIGKEALVIMIFHKFIILFFMNILPVAANIKDVSLLSLLLVLLLISVMTIIMCRFVYYLIKKINPKLIGEWK